MKTEDFSYYYNKKNGNGYIEFKWMIKSVMIGENVGCSLVDKFIHIVKYTKMSIK